MSTDITITITNEVAEAVCRGAGYLELKDGGWTNPQTLDLYKTTQDALVKALPALAEDVDMTIADAWHFAEAQPPADLENGPSAADIPDGARTFHQGLDERDRVDALEPPLGARVEFTREVDRYPHFTVPAGATGVVTQATRELYTVKLDDDIDGAEEWNSTIIWCPGDGENPADDLARDYVNRPAIKAMTDQELRDEIAAGGPAEADQAMREELGKREIAQADAYHEAHRQADSIFSDEWDINGALTIHIPAGNIGPWLNARGWEFLPGGQWQSPNGDRFWDVTEAIARQIVAEQIQLQEAS